MDIRLYKLSGTYEGSGDISEVMNRAPLEDSGTQRLETIGNKVVKFLLTSRGSDLLDPDYGAYLPTYTQISQQYLPRMQMELLDDLQRCIRYIKNKEKSLDATTEKLRTVRLDRMNYNPDTDPGRIDIYLELITTKGNRALMTVPVSTN